MPATPTTIAQGRPGGAGGSAVEPAEGGRARCVLSSFVCQAALIALATWAAYANSLHGSWQYDDQHVILTNAAIRDLDEATRQIGGSTRSLVQWTFALNYRIGGLDPFGYHVVNLIIHAASALCLFGWLRSLPAARGFAWAAALLFAVHPLATQSVSYVAQRYSSMAGLFFFAALWSWSLYRSRGAAAWLALSLLAALAAMLCKEMAVAIPLALIVADRTLHRAALTGGPLRRTAEYAMLAALLAVVPLLNLYNRDMAADQLAESLNWAPGTGLTPWTYFLSQLGVLVFVYLRLMAAPIGLSVQHSAATIDSPADPRTLAAAVILIALLAASALAAFRAASDTRRIAGFGGLLFFLGLGATSTFIPNSELVQEQRAYVSLAGFLVAMCALAQPLVRAVGVKMSGKGWGGLPARRAGGKPAPPAKVTLTLLCERPGWSTVSILALAAALAWGTNRRNDVWRSPESLWGDAVAKASDSPRAHTNLGLALADQGRSDEAIASYHRALELAPGYAHALNNLGNVHFQHGRTEQAARVFAQAVRTAPNYADAHSNLGASLERLGRLDDAIASCRRALRLRADYADAHNNLANALRAAGRAAESLPHYRVAIASYERFDQPGREARACNNLANALADLRRLEEALPLYAQALRLDPNYLTAMTNRAHVLRAVGRGNEASALLERAERIRSAPSLAARHDPNPNSESGEIP